MANIVTQVDFTGATVLGGLAGAIAAGRVDIAEISGNAAIAAPTLIDDGIPFYQLSIADIAIACVGGTITATLWVQFRPKFGLPGSFIWIKAPSAAALAAIVTGGWLESVGRPDRIAVEMTITAGTFKMLIAGEN